MPSAAGIMRARAAISAFCSGLAFERQANGNFTQIPVGPVEDFELQTFVLNRTGAIELDQFVERQVFNQDGLDEQCTGAGVE